MSLVVLDIECIDNKLVKELGNIKMDKLWDIPIFLLPKKFRATSQSAWCTKHLHGTDWISGHEKFTELQKILKKVKAPETEFFATGYEKGKFLSETLETKATKLDDYAGLNLIFKAEDYHWRCSNYPFRHAKTLHCAEWKKEKHLHTEHGLDVFLINCKLSK